MTTASDSIAWIKRTLGERVQALPVQGDQPLLLDDPSCAYVTLSEHHQLFCVGYRDGHNSWRPVCLLGFEFHRPLGRLRR